MGSQSQTLSNKHTLHDGLELACESLCPELTPETTDQRKATKGLVRGEGRRQRGRGRVQALRPRILFPA